MNPSIPSQMKAAGVDHFGGPEVLHTATLPVPEPGEWVREGGGWMISCGCAADNHS